MAKVNNLAATQLMVGLQMKTEKAKTSETENVPLSFLTFFLIRNFRDSKILHEIPSTHDTSEKYHIVVQVPHFERICPQYDQSMCHVSVLCGFFFFLLSYPYRQVSLIAITLDISQP